MRFRAGLQYDLYYMRIMEVGEDVKQWKDGYSCPFDMFVSPNCRYCNQSLSLRGGHPLLRYFSSKEPG